MLKSSTLSIWAALSRTRCSHPTASAHWSKFNDHKVSLLDVNGDKATYNKLDLPTGLWPYNVAVAPSGKIALTADNGFAGIPTAASIP